MLTDSSQADMLQRLTLYRQRRILKAMAVWSVTDSTKLRGILTDLEKQIDRLSTIQPRTRSTPSTTMQTIATVSGTLLSLDQLGVNSVTADSESDSAQQQLSTLHAMRRLKAKLESPGPGQGSNTDLYIPQAEYHIGYKETSTKNFALGSFSKTLGGSSMEVVIEWKNYLGTDPDAKKLALSRTNLIASLLASPNKPSSFRTLECVGWFVEEHRHRCGLLFRLPCPTAPNLQPPRLVSLAELIESKIKPSLADRVRLAFLLSYSLLELHLSEWLHKSFTASNILFFVVQDPKDKTAHDWIQRVDLTQPYVASFGTARPDSSFYQSEPACKVMMVEAEYRHPAYVAGICHVQGEQAERVLQPRYHRAFDVYSLGCVLLEVCTWKPLKSMGWNTAYAAAPHTWREHLKKSVARKNLSFMVGPVMTEVVVRCLGVGLDLDGEVDLEGFCWEVVERIDSIRV